MGCKKLTSLNEVLDKANGFSEEKCSTRWQLPSGLKGTVRRKRKDKDKGKDKYQKDKKNDGTSRREESNSVKKGSDKRE